MIRRACTNMWALFMVTRTLLTWSVWRGRVSFSISSSYSSYTGLNHAAKDNIMSLPFALLFPLWSKPMHYYISNLAKSGKEKSWVWILKGMLMLDFGVICLNSLYMFKCYTHINEVQKYWWVNNISFTSKITYLKNIETWRFYICNSYLFDLLKW